MRVDEGLGNTIKKAYDYVVKAFKRGTIFEKEEDRITERLIELIKTNSKLVYKTESGSVKCVLYKLYSDRSEGDDLIELEVDRKSLSELDIPSGSIFEYYVKNIIFGNEEVDVEFNERNSERLFDAIEEAIDKKERERIKNNSVNNKFKKSLGISVSESKVMNFNEFLITESSELAKILPSNIVSKVYKKIYDLTHDAKFEEVSEKEYNDNYNIKSNYFYVTNDGEVGYRRKAIENYGVRYFKYDQEIHRRTKQFRKNRNIIDFDKVVEYVSSRWGKFSKFFDERINFEGEYDIDKGRKFDAIMGLASTFFRNRGRFDEVERLALDELEGPNGEFDIKDFLESAIYSFNEFKGYKFRDKSFDEYCHGFLVYLLENIESEYELYLREKDIF